MDIVTTEQIVQLIVGLMVAVVIPYLGYHLSGWLGEAESHIHDQRLRNTISGLVAAAEQTLVDNADKYEFVYRHAGVAFPEVTHNQLNSLIEASVLALKTSLDKSVGPHLVTVTQVPVEPPSTEPIAV